jgi:hypothetical protein
MKKFNPNFLLPFILIGFIFLLFSEYEVFFGNEKDVNTYHSTIKNISANLPLNDGSVVSIVKNNIVNNTLINIVDNWNSNRLSQSSSTNSTKRNKNSASTVFPNSSEVFSEVENTKDNNSDSYNYSQSVNSNYFKIQNTYYSSNLNKSSNNGNVGPLNFQEVPIVYHNIRNYYQNNVLPSSVNSNLVGLFANNTGPRKVTDNTTSEDPFNPGGGTDNPDYYNDVPIGDGFINLLFFAFVYALIVLKRAHKPKDQLKKSFTMKRFFYIVIFLNIGAGLYSSPTDNVIFLNIGRMNVAANGVSGVSLYIPQAMRHLTVSGGDSVKVIQNGVTELGGNFYQSATTNVFGVSSLTTTTSTGTFRFITNHGSGAKRYITTYTSDSLTCASFDRGQYFVAFPNITLNSNDTLVIPARMGIDAISFHKGVTNTDGTMILRSDKLSGYDYDASLRITGVGTSSALVDLGSVIVEREMSLYRSTTSLFPFATPFYNTQISGYFAGNWVRRPVADAPFGGTTYVYGNKDNNPADNVIDMDQYVYSAAEKLVPAQPYLIKPRPAGFDYSTLQAQGGLWYTGEPAASLYDKGKFSFNGKVYKVAPYSEQLFAEDNLVSNTVNNTPSATVNWLIGNSYSCPISTVELAKQLQNSNGLTFSSTIYVLTAGSQGYQPMTISGSGNDISVSDYTEIPSMSVFMLRLSKSVAQNGTLNLGKDILRHGKFSHGSPSAIKSFANTKATSTINQINFRMSQDSNERVYDLTAIGLRGDASLGSDNYDLAKALNIDPNSFQLYTLSSTGAKLSANGVPTTVDYVRMAVKPTSDTASYKIEATNVETLMSDGAWLVDSLTNTVVNLKTDQTYRFKTTPVDKPERFKVYFKAPPGVDGTISKINGRFIDNTMILNNLTKEDLHNTVYLFNLDGNKIFSNEVKNYPEMKFNATLPPGIYILHMEGNRNQTIKLVKTSRL